MRLKHVLICLKQWFLVGILLSVYVGIFSCLSAATKGGIFGLNIFESLFPEKIF